MTTEDDFSFVSLLTANDKKRYYIEVICITAVLVLLSPLAKHKTFEQFPFRPVYSSPNMGAFQIFTP